LCVNHLCYIYPICRPENTKKEDSNKKGTKLLVRNIPFQATQSEITDLFKYVSKAKHT